jgi:hypothetical protein
MSDDYAPAPPGWIWVTFQGGTLDGEKRLVRADPEMGSTYERMVPEDEVWEWNGRVFVLVEAT